MITTRIMRMLAGLTLLAVVTAGCGTLTGAAVGAGTGDVKKGALIGTGVGAAAGAIYDFTR
jgi:outer membrane protein with glycine zipper